MMFGAASGPADTPQQQLRVPLNPPPVAEPSVARDGAGGSGFTSLSSLQGPRSLWQRIKSVEGTTLMRYLRYINVVLALLQALAGFLGLFNLITLDITSFFISVYAIVFALLLLAFECRLQSMEPWIRQMFGFLFTYRGRTAFIFMVGFMDFGMDSSFPHFVGVLMCLNALLNLLVLMYHPDFRNGSLTGSMDPTTSYNTGLDETERLLAEHQGMAARAGAFVLHEAQERPELVKQMAHAYVEKQTTLPPRH